MEVNFDSSYKIIGSRIVSYLLEKIRVVAPGEGERNYHVFYMLLAGGPSHETWADLMLEGMPADTFHFLNQSSCIAVQKRNEVAEWDDMVSLEESAPLAHRPLPTAHLPPHAARQLPADCLHTC